jgi:DNA-binding NarL/FixJ family response regulator
MDLVERHSHAIVVSEVSLPDGDGISLSQWIKRRCPATEVILSTSCASVSTATEAVRLRACDYWVKPLDKVLVRTCLERAMERHRVAQPISPDCLPSPPAELTNLLEFIPPCAFVLDRSGVVLFGNTNGKRLLERGSHLCLWPKGLLCCAVQEQQQEFEELLARAPSGVERVRSKVMGSLMLRSVSGHPNRPLVAVSLGDGHCATLLLVANPLAAEGGLGEHLRQLYGLSPAEARLALELTSGKSLEAAASRFCITTATARTQLRRLFAKTGTGRQADLIREILSGPVVFCNQPS